MFHKYYGEKVKMRIRLPDGAELYQELRNVTEIHYNFKGIGGNVQMYSKYHDSNMIYFGSEILHDFQTLPREVVLEFETEPEKNEALEFVFVPSTGNSIKM